MSGVVRFKDVNRGVDKQVSADDPLPTTGEVTGPSGAALATQATLANVETNTDRAADALEQTVTGLPATVPEQVGGTNAVLAVKVNQTGAGTVTIQAADADEKWDVLGWRLSFSAACTLTITVDDDDANYQYPFDVPAAGIDEANIVDYARFTNPTVNEPVTFANSAGNMKGVVYVRKHA